MMTEELKELIAKIELTNARVGEQVKVLKNVDIREFMTQVIALRNFEWEKIGQKLHKPVKDDIARLNSSIQKEVESVKKATEELKNTKEAFTVAAEEMKDIQHVEDNLKEILKTIRADKKKTYFFGILASIIAGAGIAGYITNMLATEMYEMKAQKIQEKVNEMTQASQGLKTLLQKGGVSDAKDEKGYYVIFEGKYDTWHTSEGNTVVFFPNKPKKQSNSQ